MTANVSQVDAPGTTIKADRLYYLDWLRVLAMLSIFLFHIDRIFDFRPFHINNDVTSLASSIHIQFFNQWMMPLFFIVSGAAVYYSLRSRNAGGFLKERVLRILVPWVLIGIFVIAPPQVYLDRVFHGEYTGNFFQWYPHYFEGIQGFGGNFAFHGQHLWYLMDLFLTCASNSKTQGLILPSSVLPGAARRCRELLTPRQMSKRGWRKKPRVI